MNTVLLKTASGRIFLGSQYIVIYKALGLACVVPTQSERPQMRGIDRNVPRRAPGTSLTVLLLPIATQAAYI